MRRVHVQVLERRRRHAREGVDHRPELAQRPDKRGALALRPREDRLDDGEAAAAKRLGDLGHRREMQDPADRGDLIRHRLGPVAPGPQHLARLLGWPEHGTGVQLGGLVQLELDRGHDAETAAAPANGPEKIGLVLAVGPDERAVCRDDLHLGDAVGREPAAPREPAHAAPERVADDADARGGSVQDDEALLGGGLDNIGPDRAGLDARPSRDDVDLDSAHQRRLHEDRVGEVTKRTGAVARSLRGDPEAVDARERDDLDDIVGRLDERDRERPLVDCEIPGLPGLVPVGIARHDDPPRQAGPQGVDVAFVGACEVVAADAFGGECHRASSGVGLGCLPPARMRARWQARIGQVADSGRMIRRPMRPSVLAPGRWTADAPGRPPCGNGGSGQA